MQIEAMCQQAKALPGSWRWCVQPKKTPRCSASRTSCGPSAPSILAANQADLEAAQAGGLSPALLDRLMLNEKRLDGIVADLRQRGRTARPGRRGLRRAGAAQRAAPAQTARAAGRAGGDLRSAPQRDRGCGRAGAQVRQLRHPARRQRNHPLQPRPGGRHPPRAGGQRHPRGRHPARRRHRPRSWCYELLQMDHYIDMVIPRGGAGLHEFCRENSRIPVITGGIGICHLFVDAERRSGRARSR